jgi:hypothetical protein
MGAAATLVEVVAATWEVASVAVDSMAVAAEVSAATTVDTAAERTVAATTVAGIRVGTLGEGDMAAHTQAGAPLHPDRGRGKAVALRAALLPAGTDLPEIVALQAAPTQ